MSVSNSIFEQIKNATDIVSEISVYVDLVKKGRNYWGICPFHDDTSPSMSVSPEKQLFKCFVCQVGGNVMTFISNYENISFVEATKKIADKVGINFNSKTKVENKYNKQQLETLKILKEAMNFFQYSLSIKEERIGKYLNERNITLQETEKYSIGYAPFEGLVKFLKSKEYDDSLIINSSLATENLSDFFRDRLIFGIKNYEGEIVGFSARILGDKKGPKYINSTETTLFDKRKILYNFKNAESHIRKTKEIIITEGYMDVIALSRADVFNAVAIMGTALTIEHTQKLMNKTVILMLDSDNAGINATLRSIRKLIPYNQSIFVVQNNSKLDPDEYLEKYGKIKLQDLIKKRIHALEFIFKKTIEKFGNDSPEKVESFLKTFTKYLANVSQTYKDFYINKLSNFLNVNKDTIKEMVDNNPKIESLPIKSQTKSIIVEETHKLKSKDKINKNKWSIKLLSAMINKPTLIPIYEKSHVNFIDPMLQVMGTYIVKLNNGIKNKPNKEIRDKLEGIKNYMKDEKKLNEAEFHDLIEVVNKNFHFEKLNKYQKKLKNKDVDKTQILEIMADIIKERE
ncbi:MAG: DNA primase [Mycoplasma sp.]|nr:DNA primase [Mycoplasma sp.]